MNKALMAAALVATALTATNANAATTVDLTIETQLSGMNVPGSPATITGQVDYDQLFAQMLTAVSGFSVLINGTAYSNFPSGVDAQFTSSNGSSGLLNFTSGNETVFSFNLTNLFSAAGRPPAGGLTETNATQFTYNGSQITIDPGSPGTLAVTEAAIAAVPEPSTWLLMLVGFGAVGYGLRRRKAAASRVSYSFA